MGGYSLSREPARGGKAPLRGCKPTRSSVSMIRSSSLSIPFQTEEQAQNWLNRNFIQLKEMENSLRDQHRGYRPE